MTAGAFTFVSWVRRGIATALNTSGADLTTKLLVTLNFQTDVDTQAVDATLDVIGPGDIVGLDPAVIVRTWPRASDLDAEYIPYTLIEFDQADLPWRYSPQPSTAATTQLAPWFSLVVLKATECSLVPPSPEQTLAVLIPNDTSVLPDAAELFAWAHTQFEGQSLDPSTPEGQSALLTRIAGAPGLFTARLISPRLLLPNTEYVACVVPTFERGRLAGLGKLPVPADTPDTVPVLDFWRTGEPDFRLPAYFAWTFRTGAIGNFEQAARLITPFALPESVGRRDMDATQTPGFGLPRASASSLPVEGALMSVAAAEAPPPTWPTGDRNLFVQRLADLVNSANNVSPDDPKLLPPLYAQWYAAADELNPTPAPTSNPKWFHELNSDPRQRVAAALGTLVVQREQQSLLAAGWDQVGEILAVNDSLRVLQLARGALGSVYARHFKTATTQRLYFLTLSLHGRLTCGGSTVCGEVKSSSIVPGFLSPQWQRLTSSRGAFGRFQGRNLVDGFIPDLIHQLAACKKPAPEPPPPPVHQPHDPRGSLPCEFIDDLAGLPNNGALFWALVILWTVRKLMVTQNGDCWWIALKALRYALSLLQIAIDPGQVHRWCRFLDGTLTLEDLLNALKMPSFNPFATLPPVLPLPAIPGASDNADAVEVRAALQRLLQALETEPTALCPPEMDVEHCATEIRAELVPSVTVGTEFTDRLDLDFDWAPQDGLEPMFAAPEIEQPMYVPLAAISPDWILPGMNGIKPNSISLAVTNQRFVEAYMAGLNHEMTRELLWHEFPTDQRGTYFRQFWDVATSILENGSPVPPDQLRDIFPFRLWDASKGLGFHSPRVPGGDGGTTELLVLVIRAELARKYPNVVVYCQRRDAATDRLTGSQNRPIFQGRIEPDTAFFGFNLTVADIEGDDDLYFVLQEHPGDPKFADEFSVATDARSDSLRYSSPGSLLGDTAGAVAQKTFLQPFRIGFQAKSMLPAAP
jgi:hypothetical protein